MPNCNNCGEPWVSEPGDRYRAGRRCKNCRQTATKDIPWDQIKKLETRKSRLIRERGYRCEKCLNEVWNEQPIPLELHHVNGDGKDNRKENLKLLCANCHAQTPNFGWRKKHSKNSPSDATGVAARLSTG